MHAFARFLAVRQKNGRLQCFQMKQEGTGEKLLEFVQLG